jgi:ankyrin repeat protein
MSDEIRRAFLACTRGDIGILASLVPSQVTPNQAVSFIFSDLSVFLSFPWSVSGVTCRHVTMLHIASGCSQLECMSYLLHKGALVNSIDLMKRTPLHYAVQYGETDATDLLLSSGAKVNAEDAAVCPFFQRVFSLHISHHFTWPPIGVTLRNVKLY